MIAVEWQYMAVSDKSPVHRWSGVRINPDLHCRPTIHGNTFLTGLKQRLLSFVFRGIWNEESDDSLVRFESFQLRIFIKF